MVAVVVGVVVDLMFGVQLSQDNEYNSKRVKSYYVVDVDWWINWLESVRLYCLLLILIGMGNMWLQDDDDDDGFDGDDGWRLLLLLNWVPNRGDKLRGSVGNTLWREFYFLFLVFLRSLITKCNKVSQNE